MPLRRPSISFYHSSNQTSDDLKVEKGLLHWWRLRRQYRQRKMLLLNAAIAMTGLGALGLGETLGARPAEARDLALTASRISILRQKRRCCHKRVSAFWCQST
jgi:hypothetical protein